jgi:hypothetical protein
MKTSVRRSRRFGKRRPFWLPASSFYFLVVALAIASFFLVVGLYHDGSNNNEWVAAGLVASGVLVSGFVLRELVLRHARERYLIEQNRLDRNLRHPVAFSSRGAESSKFTLEKNKAALETIKKKSEAANIFGRISAGHREVFELCDEYRAIVANEIPSVHPDSPRLKALTKGSELAGELHRYHLMRWAEVEARSLSQEAQAAETVEAKAVFAQRARSTIEFALSRYPSDAKLRESAAVLDELLDSLNDPEFAGSIGPSDAESSSGAEFEHQMFNSEITRFEEIVDQVDDRGVDPDQDALTDI